MSCLGVLFSLGQLEVDKLKSFTNDEERLEYLQEDLEETYFDEYPQYVTELDKSWDALHRSLTDGHLTYSNGTFPLNHVILGGEILYTSGDYIMTLKTPEQVRTIADALESVNRDTLRQGYYQIDQNDYGFSLTDEDFEYTWDWLDQSKGFWKLAAENGRYVLFTVDQ